MVEIYIPKTWSYNTYVGVWEGSSTLNQLYLGQFKSQTPMRFDVDEVLFRIRCKGLLPFQIQGSGKLHVTSPIKDTIYGDFEPGPVVIDGKIEWTYGGNIV